VTGPGRWLADGQADLAVERILDAAGTVFVERGIAATGMGHIATAASCSRATLYRYFDDREALRLAYVEREARRIATAVARETSSIPDPARRMAESILASVGLVRSDRVLAAWFNSADQGITTALSARSSVVERLAAGLTGDTGDLAAARWVVRIIMSMLTVPAADAEAERELVEQFVVPPLLARVPPRSRVSGGGRRRSPR